LAEYWTLAGTVRGPLPKQDTDALVEQEQATVADPVPLGLAALAATLFTIGTVYAGWFGLAAAPVAIPLALVYGGIGLFLAGMWAFRRGNVLMATALTTIGCFNASWAVLELLLINHTIPTLGTASGPSYVAGVYILTFWVIVGYLGLAALGTNRMIAGILLLLSLGFLCLGTGIWIGGSHNWLMSIGGYCAIVAALLAAYESAAIVINSTIGRGVLPVFAVPRVPQVDRPASGMTTGTTAPAPGV
jgi:succinate-acetate transporter protein